MEKKDKNNLIGITALLVHAAKIDEIYTESEKEIVKKFIGLSIESDSECKDIMLKAEKLELNSNQLLDFTNLIKKESLESKTEIIRNLWKIIISDKKIDQFESNLIRRICGLIYFPDKLSGEIKLKILELKS
jgi:uncharacterized tellurite resistance protein B-like protein